MIIEVETRINDFFFFLNMHIVSSLTAKNSVPCRLNSEENILSFQSLLYNVYVI